MARKDSASHRVVNSAIVPSRRTCRLPWDNARLRSAIPVALARIAVGDAGFRITIFDNRTRGDNAKLRLERVLSAEFGGASFDVQVTGYILAVQMASARPRSFAGRTYEKPSEYIFDGFSYAFERLFIDRGYVLVEAARVDEPYLRNDCCRVLVADEPDRRSVWPRVRR